MDSRSGIPFIKMHGLGNDFVIFDARDAGQPGRPPFEIGEAAARAIADRRTGIGCDQLIVLEAPRDKDAEAFMAIRNADGGASNACGNATRCVAALLMDQSGNDEAVIETAAGILIGRGTPDGVTVDMGVPRLDWREVPLSREMDTLHIDLALGELTDAAACSMGNPHATFFVDDLTAVDIPTVGPKLENDALFPERANIGFARVINGERVRLRVWERGAGLTPACATGSCAAVVNAVRRGLTTRRVTCELDGGSLIVEWRKEDEHVLMTGPVAVAFTGLLTPALLSAAKVGA